jgi:dissimilatory sulfite reductase (desulfoviridin) alpha/beta subunit
MVKIGQRWSKMVDFKYLTTFGEIAEKSGSGKIKHAKVSKITVSRVKVRLAKVISTRALHALLPLSCKLLLVFR